MGASGECGGNSFAETHVDMVLLSLLERARYGRA